MDTTTYFAAIFLGLVGFSWLCHQLFGFAVFAWRPTIGWLRTHFISSRIFHGQHLFNPTRAEVACHVAHWTSMAIFNTCKLTDISEAASRAAFGAVVHLIPLVFSSQVGFVSQSFGISPSVGLSFHGAFGCMAAVQGTVHGTLKLLHQKDWTWRTKLGLVALCSLVASSCLPFVRSRAYEAFLVAHRALTVSVALALWLHLRPQQGIARRLWFGTFFLFLAISCYRYASQIHSNLGPIRSGVQLTRIEEVRRHDGCLILALKLPKHWRIRPGQHVFLTVLTLRCASVFQRHPFTVTWWDDSEPSRVYIMIRARRGWTKSIAQRLDFLDRQTAWLDGPFGIPLRLENYGAVLLLASGDGIFGQLPLIKGLTEAYKTLRAKTRRIKLVWLTTEFNEQLQEWIQTILDDEELHTSLLDLSIHQPKDSIHAAGASRVHKLGRRLKMVYDAPNVHGYVQSELRHPKTEVAITVSAHPQLRNRVRDEVLRINGFKVRLFELDYQPYDSGQYDGGIAA